jgi:diguanylate cyclase (GGDEF)-like protein
MIDIDGFKNCNDSFGHLVGDVVLRDVARLMRESVREIDLVARYGGEEFSVVLPETGRSEARIVAERVRKRIEENDFRAYDETLKMTISVGVSAYPDDSSDADGLIEAADEALYAAKAAGKNIVCEYGKGYRKRT